MSDTETNNDQQEGPFMPFTAQLLKAQSLIEDGPQQESSSGRNSNTAGSGSGDSKSCPISQALVILEKLQEYVQTACIFSNNESLSDIQTSSLPLLAVEYHMAKVLFTITYELQHF
jgi:TAP42-like family.